ncbi:MAG: tRNA-intron lyase [Thermoprotei archaeon]
MVEKKYQVKIKNDEIIIDDPGVIGELYDLGYGIIINHQLKLETFEALYLVEKGKIILIDDDHALTLEESIDRLSKIDQKLWIKYTIYSDLRNKGYIVKPGFTHEDVEFRVYERDAKPGKEPAKYLVRVLIEGEPILMKKLMDMVKNARDSRKDLVIAIIDAQGDIAYYEVSEVRV